MSSSLASCCFWAGTDGVSFSQKTGSGSATVEVIIDSEKLKVGINSIPITASAGDVSVTAVVHIEVYQPSLVDQHSHEYTQIFLRKNIADPGTAPLNFELPNDASVPVRATRLPEWLSISSSEGLTGVPFSVASNENAQDEGYLYGEVEFTIDIPDAPIAVTRPVGIAIDHFRLDPLQYAYAFSGYATTGSHQGRIQFRQNHLVLEQGITTALEATSDQSWLLLDNASVKGFDFHLQVDGLADGFHLATLDIAHPSHSLIRPTRVYIGYYKSGQAPVVRQQAGHALRNTEGKRCMCGRFLSGRG